MLIVRSQMLCWIRCCCLCCDLLGNFSILLNLEPALDPTIHTLIQTPDFSALLLARSFPLGNAISQADQRLGCKNRTEASCTVNNNIAGVRLLNEFRNITFEDTTGEDDGSGDGAGCLDLVAFADVDHMRGLGCLKGVEVLWGKVVDVLVGCFDLLDECWERLLVECGLEELEW